MRGPDGEMLRMVLNGEYLPAHCDHDGIDGLVDSLAYVTPSDWQVHMMAAWGERDEWEALAAMAAELTRLGKPLPLPFIQWFDKIRRGDFPAKPKGGQRKTDRNTRIMRGLDYCTQNGMGHGEAVQRVADLLNLSPETINTVVKNARKG